jgi:hypothetical protein
MTGRSGQIRQTTTAEVCLDEGQATSFGPARQETGRRARCLGDTSQQAPGSSAEQPDIPFSRFVPVAFEQIEIRLAHTPQCGSAPSCTGHVTRADP